MDFKYHTWIKNNPCKTRTRVNRAIVDGQEYEITDQNYNAITADFIALVRSSNNGSVNGSTSAMSNSNFATKWAHVRRHPARNSASTPAPYNIFPIKPMPLS